MNETPKTMTDTPITRVMIGVVTALLTAFIFGLIGFLVDAIRPDYFIIKLGGVPRAEFAALEHRLTTVEARVILNPDLSKLEVEQLLRNGVPELTVTELKIKEPSRRGMAFPSREHDSGLGPDEPRNPILVHTR